MHIHTCVLNVTPNWKSIVPKKRRLDTTPSSHSLENSYSHLEAKDQLLKYLSVENDESTTGKLKRPIKNCFRNLLNLE